jgi:hypothetical protein
MPHLQIPTVAPDLQSALGILGPALRVMHNLRTLLHRLHKEEPTHD